MSVIKANRNQSVLEASLMAMDLAIYTLRITKNKKVFTEDYQRAFTDGIISTAKDIYMDVWTANNIMVVGENAPVLWQERDRLQRKAVCGCNSLLAQIQMAHKVFHLSLKRVKHWGSMVIETRDKIRAWNSADAKRYKKI